MYIYIYIYLHTHIYIYVYQNYPQIVYRLRDPHKAKYELKYAINLKNEYRHNVKTRKMRVSTSRCKYGKPDSNDRRSY